MLKIFSNKPWLPVALLLGVFLGSWCFFIALAIKNQPATVPLVTVPASQEGKADSPQSPAQRSVVRSVP